MSIFKYSLRNVVLLYNSNTHFWQNSNLFQTFNITSCNLFIDIFISLQYSMSSFSTPVPVLHYELSKRYDMSCHSYYNLTENKVILNFVLVHIASCRVGLVI